MEKVSWIKRKSNQDIIRIVGEERSIIYIFKVRRWKNGRSYTQTGADTMRDYGG